MNPAFCDNYNLHPVDGQVGVRYSTQDSNLKCHCCNQRELRISESNLILTESRKNWSLEEPLCPLIKGAYRKPQRRLYGALLKGSTASWVYRGKVLFN